MSERYAIAVARFYEELAERLERGARAAFAEAARGVMSVQLQTGVPCAFGVLTCETMEQALARSGGGVRDQGRRAAEAVLAMAALRRELHGG